MTDTKSPGAATEGTWALPLLVLAPVALIRFLAEPSALWGAVSWGLLALSALLVGIGWMAVFRRGVQGSAGWGTCILVHAVLAWQLIALLGE
ncbi:hypothetical protein ACX6XY_19690 [Streptomyces sp. O3]